MYYCGLDGGGTKTALCAIDQEGNVIGKASFGPMNLNGSDPETVRNTVRDILAFMAAQLPDGLSGCIRLCLGMAGISNQTTVCFVREAFQIGGYNGPLLLTGDQNIALHGAIHGHGAVLIAGTGSVCCGRDEHGTIYRTGGYGYLIDDVGSGYAIGHDILTAVVRAHDSREPQTVLTAALYDHLGISRIEELITWLYAPTTGKKGVAALAPLLIPALNQADTAALSIADNAAKALADLVLALWRKSGMSGGELAMTGGVLTHYPLIAKNVSEIIENRLPGILIHVPYHTPDYGAALLALEHKKEG